MKQETAVKIGKVVLSSPNKILYPDDGVTKLDYARYLLAVGPRLLAHVQRRLISLVRCPDGQAGECFFQRHTLRGFTSEVKQFERADKSEPFLYIENMAGLIGLAQMNVLEIHIWGSHIDSLEKPDRMVFDLDPADNVSFATVKEGALRVREVLLALGLKSFPLLSGGKGIHVVVPLMPTLGWDTIKEFSGAVAARMAADQPERYVDTMTKSKRQEKIFIDFFRNDRSATAIAPYSARARVGASVAWPIGWDHLPKFKTANQVTIKNYAKYLTGEPWKGAASLKQQIKPAAAAALGVEL